MVEASRDNVTAWPCTIRNIILAAATKTSVQTCVRYGLQLNWLRLWCRYWKIDGPDLDCACSKAAKEVFPSLMVEHGFCPVTGCPLNDPHGEKVYTSAAAQQVMHTLGCSDVFRSYDTVPTLSTPTTLSRLSTILHVANTSLPPGSNQAMLNGDAESLVTASLGCALGVMRSPLVGLRPEFQDKGMSAARDVDLFFMGNRKAKQRLDEIDRIVRWGRIAPPFGARAEGGTDLEIDQALLCDSWAFEPGDTWDKSTWGTTLQQCAPARVTRGGLPLPHVVEVTKESHPPRPVSLQPCWATRDKDQLWVNKSGTLGLQTRSDTCLLGNTTDRRVYTAACGTAAAGSKSLKISADGLIRVGANTCATAANCTMHNDTQVDCTAGSDLKLEACAGTARVLQIWKLDAADYRMSKSAAHKLVLQASDYKTSGQPRCTFGPHTPEFSVSDDGSKATVTGQAANTIMRRSGKNSNVIGSCTNATTDSGFHFSVFVKTLSGQAFIGVSKGHQLTDWANTKGSYAYGSTGIRASQSGYATSGLRIDPRTGRKAILESFGAGDVVRVSIVNGVMTVAKNGGSPVVIFESVPTNVSVSIWSAPSSTGSSFHFAAYGGGVPMCVTAASAAMHAAPFVVSTRYPGDHAVSIASLARTAPRPIGYHTPAVNVTQEVLLGMRNVHDGKLPAIGIFGTFSNLNLKFYGGTVGHISTVYAQDLRGDQSIDVTKLVDLDRAQDVVSLSGELIARVGTSAKSLGDLSEPGLVLSLSIAH